MFHVMSRKFEDVLLILGPLLRWCVLCYLWECCNGGWCVYNIVFKKTSHSHVTFFFKVDSFSSFVECT